MEDISLGMVAVWCALWGAIGGAVASGKSMGAAGGVLIGAILGPSGVLIAAVSKDPPEPTTLERIERTADAPGWHPDPLGRFDARYYDGQRWTQHVGRVGADGSRQQFEDPV